MKTKKKNIKVIKEEKGKIQPLGDRVLVRELSEVESEKTTAAGIIIPITVHDDKGAKKAKVVAVGLGRYDNGKLIPPNVRVGDHILFSWGDTIKVDGEEYTIVRETEIIAIIR